MNHLTATGRTRLVAQVRFFFFKNSGVPSGGSTRIARRAGLIAFLIDGGSVRLANLKTTLLSRWDWSTGAVSHLHEIRPIDGCGRIGCEDLGPSALDRDVRFTVSEVAGHRGGENVEDRGETGTGEQIDERWNR